MFIQISWSRIGKPYNYAEFLCETDSDIAVLPIQKGKCAIGSKAFVLSTGKTYILNNSNQWIQYNGSSSSVGADSYIPVRGVDYWTETDKAEIVQSVETDIQPTIAAIQDAANTATITANTATNIAKGANQSLSYGNYQTMITAFNALDDDAYNVGQNVMIITLNVPDLWISSIESTSQTYTYTTDAAFINGLETNGYVQVGYYRLSALETQKVDLTNYYTKTQTDNLLSAKVDKSSFVYDSNTETLSITIS